MSEKCDIVMGKPGSGVSSLKWLATHWLCAWSELFFFLNLRVFTVKMGSIHAKPPGCLQGCREMMHINPSRVSRGCGGGCMAQSLLTLLADAVGL